MKKEKDLSVAVLIDGDNASSEKMEDVMRFVSRYGAAVVRRIYGDWTKKSLSGWKDAARDYSFRMVQASSFVPGKNTTDIALVMDAMDILHEGRVGCFCLVASDGDYTLLAQRIRESGLTVLGYGEGKTPVALVRSCTEFLLADGKAEVSLSLIGGVLKKLMPKFKVKRYGCRTLGKLYERLEKYELVKTGKGVAGLVRIKS